MSRTDRNGLAVLGRRPWEPEHKAYLAEFRAPSNQELIATQTVTVSTVVGGWKRGSQVVVRMSVEHRRPTKRNTDTDSVTTAQVGRTHRQRHKCTTADSQRDKCATADRQRLAVFERRSWTVQPPWWCVKGPQQQPRAKSAVNISTVVRSRQMRSHDVAWGCGWRTGVRRSVTRIQTRSLQRKWATPTMNFLQTPCVSNTGPIMWRGAGGDGKRSGISQCLN